MSGEERRKQIIEILGSATKPISGDELAAKVSVSRQVIVQDMALLRANNVRIYSTNRGYLLEKDEQMGACRVFKVVHSDEDTSEEMNLIVDQGGCLLDVFIYHRVYGVMRGELNVKSRRDVSNYLKQIETGRSSLLKNVTGGYHYHTVMADSEEILDIIQKELSEKGFLAPLSEYEPSELTAQDNNA